MQRTHANITDVGACMYRCRQPSNHHYYPVPSNRSELRHVCNSTTAGINGIQSWNQDGQLCGRCYKGFGLPAYSHDWRCIKCSHNKHSVINSIVKYCIIVFLPLTGFFIMLVTLRISVTSPSMNAFVLACQVLTVPLLIRISLSSLEPTHNHPAVVFAHVIVSLNGFWNLDFFRTLHPLFCLSPDMSTLQILVLDYFIAAYPLLLIFIT